MEQQIGQIVRTLQPVNDLPSPSMDLQLPSAAWQMVPFPETDEECQALAEWAETAPTISHPLATFDEIAEALMFLNAVLPSRNFDEQAGEQRTAVFMKILSDYTKPQIDYMVERAARELEWFPVPKQMIDILDRGPKPYNPRDEARRKVASYHTNKYYDWVETIPHLTPEQITAAPERWKRIAETEMHIRQLDDGTYTHRRMMRAAA